MRAPRHDARDKETVCDRLGAIARESWTGEVELTSCLIERERMLSALRKRRGFACVGIAAWVGAGALVAAGTVGLRAVRHAPAAVWWLENAVTSEDGFVMAARSDASAMIRFASGAYAELVEGSRGRVLDAGTNVSRVVLEAGRARVHGRSHPRISVVVEAGPYAMRGGEADFEVSWSGSALEVRVASGSVMVRGPLAEEGLMLYSDQVLVARNASMRVAMTPRASENGACPQCF